MHSFASEARQHSPCAPSSDAAALLKACLTLGYDLLSEVSSDDPETDRALATLRRIYRALAEN